MFRNNVPVIIDPFTSSTSYSIDNNNTNYINLINMINTNKFVKNKEKYLKIIEKNYHKLHENDKTILKNNGASERHGSMLPEQHVEASAEEGEAGVVEGTKS
jgi:hypothetical protein